MKKPLFRNVLEEALFLRVLLIFAEKPSTKNCALTKDQISHRGYRFVSFSQMQKEYPLVVEN